MVQPSLSMSKSGLARLWAHEALRVFHDRLVTHDDKMRCRTLLAEAAAKHLPNLVLEQDLLGSRIMFADFVNTQPTQTKGRMYKEVCS